MGRGGSCYLTYTAFVLLSRISTTTADGALFKIDIWQGPAPSPKDGPPFSANASRNRDILPYQIIGIVGAYVGCVLIIGTLLLTVGRKLRKRAQSMASQPREMVKPLSKTFERSPISPQSSSSRWYSPRKLRDKKSATSSIRSGVSNQMSPGMDSVVSFDNNVIEADRARRQEEMERLYAAVMLQDDRRSASQQNVGATEGMPSSAPPEYSRRKPPRLITDDPGLRHLQANSVGPISPLTPKSPIRAIYPPDSPMPRGPSSPTSPIKAEYPPFAGQVAQYELPTPREARASSFGSAQNGTAANVAIQQQPKKIRKSLRNLKISAPIITDDNDDGARTPLSPRFYTDPGIPPEPPTAGTAHSSAYPPTTPGTARSWTGRYPGEEVEEQLDEVRDLPSANPQRLSTHIYNNQAQMVTNAASTRPDPTKPAGTASGTGALPFREMNRQYAQANYSYPQRSPNPSQSAFPLSPGQWNNPNVTSPNAPNFQYLTSAGPVKTTFLSPVRNNFGAPRTGMVTPYSPYMPFTPLTPVTPHLTSRAERRQRAKEERKLKGAITEEEAVAEEGELWSSGY